MITMVTEGRKPLFGKVAGRSDAMELSAEAPHVELSPLGAAEGYNDQILLRDGQLENWLAYLKDNPRRLLMKREQPDLFRVQRGLTFAGLSFSAIGNRFLLQRPVKLQVQCSRSITDAGLQVRLPACLQAARQGAVLVTPAISTCEKAIMRAAFNESLPLIYQQENGFTDLAKQESAWKPVPEVSS